MNMFFKISRFQKKNESLKNETLEVSKFLRTPFLRCASGNAFEAIQKYCKAQLPMRIRIIKTKYYRAHFMNVQLYLLTFFQSVF